MHFFTRMLVMVLVMNTIIVLGQPLVMPSADVPNTLGDVYGYQISGDPRDPNITFHEQNLTQSLGEGGIVPENPLTGLIAPFQLASNFIGSIGAFINAPIGLMSAMNFPDPIVLIAGAAYYLLMIIGALGLLTGRNV